MTEKSILALDLATQMGWAVYCNKSTVSGSESFSRLKSQKVGVLFHKYQTWLSRYIHTLRVDFVAYELVDFPIRNRPYEQIYHGMVAILMSICEDKGIEYRGFRVSDIKIEATGKGNAKKPDMIATARAQWPDQGIIDDNQADALWLLYLAAKKLGCPVAKHHAELF